MAKHLLKLQVTDEFLGRFSVLKKKLGLGKNNNGEVIMTSLQLCESFVDEYLSGTRFFRQRIGEIGPNEFKVFGETTSKERKVVCININK